MSARRSPEAKWQAPVALVVPSDIADRVVETVRDAADGDGWCSRAQVDALMGATSIDKREVDRALKVAVANGRLEQDGNQYRAIE